MTDRTPPPDRTGDTIDLGGCSGCSLGCAVACSDGREDRATEARQTLVASGVAVVFLAVVPGLVSRSLLVQALAALGAACGAATLATAAYAVRRGRPAGDRAARLGFRALPLGVAAMAATWVAALVVWLTG
ncbi:hypothetical protein [Egicoccus sp. AB-alg2]|uniref:hypothetical protein n=1 Tax=Egicoccus sp. AB-alg2 TaxID=3242693 RepID=UPI00359E1308